MMGLDTIKEWYEAPLANWVKFRTSFKYVWFFAVCIFSWILVNKLGIFVFDNADLTYLNLTISVLTELQAVLLLVYMARMSERDKKSDKERRSDIKKLTALLERALEDDKETE